MGNPLPRRRKPPRPHPHRRLLKRRKRGSRPLHRPQKRPALRPLRNPPPKEKRKPARPHWSARSPASTVSISPKFPALDSAAASPSRTSWHSSSARRRQHLPLRQRRLRSRQPHLPSRGQRHRPPPPIPAISSR